MYIRNLSSTSIPAFECGACLANYLIRNSLPLLSQKDKSYYFAETKELRDLLDHVPFYIKLAERINNGFRF